MKFITKILIIILLFTCSAESRSAPDELCKSVAFQSTFPKSRFVSDILCYKRYTIGFSRDLKSPLWTAEHLTKEQDSLPNVKRKDRFRLDPNIPAHLQGSLRAYEGTAFDRGHLTNFDNLGDDLIAADETFVMTNIVPQYAINNRGIWKALETRTRKLAVEKGQVYILTGPIYENPKLTLRDGTPIPTKLFKIIIMPNTKESITYIIPNSMDAKTSDLAMYVSKIADLKKTNAHIASFVSSKVKLKELKQFPEI